MADWSYGLNDAATVKRYSHKLFRAAMQRTTVAKLCLVGASERSEENPVQIIEDLKKGEGDQVTVKLLAELEGDGVVGDNELAGTEESITPYTDTVKIDQLRHSVNIKGAMSAQRVPEKMRDEAMAKLSTWWKRRLDITRPCFA